MKVEDALKAGLTIRLVDQGDNGAAQMLNIEGWWPTSKVTRQTDDDPDGFAKRVREDFVVKLIGAIGAFP